MRGKIRENAERMGNASVGEIQQQQWLRKSATEHHVMPSKRRQQGARATRALVLYTHNNVATPKRK